MTEPKLTCATCGKWVLSYVLTRTERATSLINVTVTWDSKKSYCADCGSPLDD